MLEESQRLDEEAKGRIPSGCHWRCSVIEWSQENRQFCVCDWSRKVIGGLEVHGGDWVLSAGQVGMWMWIGRYQREYPGKLKEYLLENAVVCVELGDSSHECAFDGP